jgi:hypothetical protein
MKTTLLRLTLLGLVIAAAVSERENAAMAQGASRSMPVFQVDPSWPKLPNNWVVGTVSSVTVDRRDHVWILHRPGTVQPSLKAQAAPPVLEFDATGAFVRGVARGKVMTGPSPSTASPSTTKMWSGSAEAVSLMTCC